MQKLVYLSLFFLLGACSGGEEIESPPSSALQTGGICEEHEIQRAICTKCNPALIPVFQAKGDFCEEHGFAESSCPICHPEKKGVQIVDMTPPKKAPPADGIRVRFKTKETTRLAGIKTARAMEHTSNAVVLATATIAYDATRFAQINARASGVVRELKADIGTTIDAGETLAIIQSAAVGAERSRLQGAAANLKVTKANYERVKSLVEQGISPGKNLLQAQAELERAQAEYTTISASLGEIDKGARGVGSYSLTSPIAGTVIRRDVTLGRMVDKEDVLFEVVDTSFVWVEMDIPEADLSLVSVGQKVAIKVDSLPDKEFQGTISYLAPEVDKDTRTVKARAEIENSQNLLLANMFAQALILGEEQNAVVVPRSSVQHARGVSMVFVKLAEDLYEARHVSLLADTGAGDMLGVSGGIEVGDEIATEGSFLLKTETLKESIGAGCCEEN